MSYHMHNTTTVIDGCLILNFHLKMVFDMKRFFLLAAVLFQLGFLPAMAQTTINDPNVEVRPVGSFNSIVVSSAIDLVITQSKNVVVAVSASDAKSVEHITTEVRNNTLYIGYKNGVGWGAKYMRAYVSVPMLVKIGASGACNVKTDGAFTTNDLEIVLSGSSDFKGTVQVNNLKMIASGSSDIVIAGKATNMRADLSGASDLKAFELSADYCDVTASGASDIQIMVNKELKAAASGASDIFYKGEGVVKSVSASGASDIKKRS